MRLPYASASSRGADASGPGTLTPSLSRSNSPYTAGVDSPPSATAKTQWNVAADLQLGELFAAAGAQRRAAHQAERHIAAQLGADREQFVAGGAEAPQRVAREQRTGAVRAAAGHAARDGDVLGDVDVDVRGQSVAGGQQLRGPRRQVRTVQGDLVGVGALAGDRQRRRAGRHGDLVVQRHREEDVRQVVEAVGARAAHRQLDVDLRGTRTVTRCSTLTPSPPRSVRTPPPSGPRRGPAARRPRRRGPSPPPPAEPAQPASAARSVLRRCANAASTTAKTSAFDAVVVGGFPAHQGDQPGVHVGRGPEDVAADGSGALHLRVPVRLHRGHAVDLVAGRSRRAGRRPPPGPSPASARWSGSGPAWCSSTGTATLYGRLATSAVGAGPGSSVTSIASECTSEKRSARPGMRGRDGRRQRAGEHVVDLHGHDPVGRLQQRQRQRPEPGPDLDDHVVLAHLGGAHDPADGVGVDDEVLAALLGGAYAQRCGQFTDVGGAEECVGLSGAHRYSLRPQCGHGLAPRCT